MRAGSTRRESARRVVCPRPSVSMSESRSTARRLHEITRLHRDEKSHLLQTQTDKRRFGIKRDARLLVPRSIRDEADCKKCIYWTLTVKFPPNLRETSQPVEIGVHVSFSLSFTCSLVQFERVSTATNQNAGMNRMTQRFSFLRQKSRREPPFAITFSSTQTRVGPALARTRTRRLGSRVAIPHT